MRVHDWIRKKKKRQGKAGREAARQSQLLAVGEEEDKKGGRQRKVMAGCRRGGVNKNRFHHQHAKCRSAAPQVINSLQK